MAYKIVNSLHAGKFLVLSLVSAYFFFQNLLVKIFSFRNTIRVSNGLDQDQDQCSVDPDLGPNCLQRFLADNKSHHWRGKS